MHTLLLPLLLQSPKPTLGRNVLKPSTSSLWPLNSSLTRAMTPAVSILQVHRVP
jgi:hypothetical protein